MAAEVEPGRILLLNGVPSAGKSSLCAAVQDRFEGVWMNLGLDRFKAMTPDRYQPGIGLRPGGERPDLEPLVATLYLAMYRSIAVHARLGVNVVADVGHHDGYARPLGILPACARELSGLEAWLIGVRCPLETILERRVRQGRLAFAADGSPAPPVVRFQEQIHRPGVYDLELDTSRLTPEEAADLIRDHLETGPPPTALGRLAGA